jgi:hypothetical protein
MWNIHSNFCIAYSRPVVICRFNEKMSATYRLFYCARWEGNLYIMICSDKYKVFINYILEFVTEESHYNLSK